MNKILMIITFIYSLAAVASDFPIIEDRKLLRILSDSHILGPPYEKIVEELLDLEKRFPETAKVIEYGTSVSGKKLTLIKIFQKNVTGNAPAVYIGGSIHGDEYLNIEDRLPRWFLEDAANGGVTANYLNQGGVIYIAPILNPDGYNLSLRENDNGIDLNRDYTVLAADIQGFTEPETTSLVKFLEQDLSQTKKKLEVAFDYHCCTGALLYPWSFTGPQLSSVDEKRHSAIASAMHQALGRRIRFGKTPDILGYSARGTSKDFYFEKFGARSFTYEGRQGKEDRYFGQHTRMWKNILELFLK